jgi:hypothetical protein
MGSPVGTYNDDELKGLSEADREELKRAALKELYDSKDIRKIIENHPTLLTRDREINKKLRGKLDSVLNRLRKK